MLNLKILPLVILPFVAACSGTLSVPKITPVETSAASCGAALLGTGSTDLMVLTGAAATNPACVSLAKDGLDLVVKDVLKKNVMARQIKAESLHQHAPFH